MLRKFYEFKKKNANNFGIIKHLLTRTEEKNRLVPVFQITLWLEFTLVCIILQNYITLVTL